MADDIEKLWKKGRLNDLFDRAKKAQDKLVFDGRGPLLPDASNSLLIRQEQENPQESISDLVGKTGASNRDAAHHIFRETGYGDLRDAIQNVSYGINHRGFSGVMPINTDQYGLTFFTRPNLNLSYNNLEADRFFHSLQTSTNMNLMGDWNQALRVLLSPRLPHMLDQRIITSPLVDDKLAFFPLLTNALISISGWPDDVMDTFTAEEGVQKESWSMADGVTRNFGVFDITATFRNMAGDPITMLFAYWRRYMGRVYDGTMTPWPDCIVENEIDYMTRIYRIVLDHSRTRVQKIAAVGAAFPTVSPMGAHFDYNAEHPVDKNNEQISVNFRCMGVDYMDPILIHEFNMAVANFNRDMTPIIYVDDGAGGSERASGAIPSAPIHWSPETAEGRQSVATRGWDMVKSLPRDNPNAPKRYYREGGVFEQKYTKLGRDELNYYNFRGYPRIDPVTLELEWWVPNDVYEQGTRNRGLR